MYKIKVPASSANVGSGFDVLGLALDLYNVYGFEKSDSFALQGFNSRFSLSNNLVKISYDSALKAFGFKPLPVKISLLESGIYKTGGLGNSAACIVAGVLAAAHFCGIAPDKKTIFNVAAQVEGHPDNVAPALFGGLVASYKGVNGYNYESYKISPKLKLMLCCPDFFVSTKAAREELPKSQPYSAIVDNLSRIVNLPRAFERGDMELLREAVKDNLHEPYRLKHILEGEKIRAAAEKCGAVALVSGSGASMLLIGNSTKSFKEVLSLKTEHKWLYRSVKPAFGAQEIL